MGDRDRRPDQLDPKPDREGPGQGQGGNGGGASPCPDRQDGDDLEELGPHGPGSDPDD
jgi:hypothetical protein